MGRLVSRTKAVLAGAADMGSAGVARLRLALGRSVRFSGAFPSREAAVNSLSEADRVAYDRDDVVEVSLGAMSRVMVWDYPVIFWLDRIAREAGPRVVLLDAGGHLGTKYLAFQDHLELARFDWAIWDLPALVRAGREAQHAGTLPPALRFVDRPGDAGAARVLLASGLLQYLDTPFADLVRALPDRPRWIVLNKVAMWPGPELVTIERIGPGRVPYRIRNEAAVEAEIASLGYGIRDNWTIPALGHRIETHPWRGTSVSQGYVLERLESPAS